MIDIVIDIIADIASASIFFELNFCKDKVYLL